MKKITLLFSILTVALLGNAQGFYHLESVGAKAPFTSQVTSGVSYGFIFQTNATTPVINDVLSSEQVLPFPYTFYGVKYTTYKVSDNGYVTFDVDATTSSKAKVQLPDTNAPKAAIFGFWDDLRLKNVVAGGTYGAINYTVGVSPNRQHIIKWFNAIPAAAADGQKYLIFSVVLHEKGGFDVIHEGNSGNGAYTEAATVGCQNADGTLGYTARTNFAFQNNVFPDLKDDYVLNFKEGTANANDAGVLSLNLLSTLGRDRAPFVFKGNVQNYGSEALTSFDINYSINGGTPVTSKINSNISKGGFSTYTHPINWTPSAAGNYEIKVFTSNPNGVTDENAANDAYTLNVTVLEQVYDRKPLYEIYTSSTCPPCRPGNQVFHSVIDSRLSEATYIKWQQNFPGTGDPYATAESVNRRAYYNINSIPRMEIDGGWDQNASAFTSVLHDASKSVPSLVKIESTFDKWAKSVRADIKVSSIGNLTGPNMLNVVIFETLTYKNVKTNGETQFENVFKKYMTPLNGENLGNLTANQPIEKTYTINFNGDYVLPLDGQASSYPNFNAEHTVENFNNLRVLAWVQNGTSKNVLQSEYATEIKASTSAMAAQVDVKVYPNPTAETGYIDLNLVNSSDVTITITDITGKIIDVLPYGMMTAGSNTLILDTKPYSSGVLFLNVTTDEGSATKRIVINK